MSHPGETLHRLKAGETIKYTEFEKFVTSLEVPVETALDFAKLNNSAVLAGITERCKVLDEACLANDLNQISDNFEELEEQLKEPNLYLVTELRKVPKNIKREIDYDQHFEISMGGLFYEANFGGVSVQDFFERELSEADILSYLKGLLKQRKKANRLDSGSAILRLLTVRFENITASSEELGNTSVVINNVLKFKGLLYEFIADDNRKKDLVLTKLLEMFTESEQIDLMESFIRSHNISYLASSYFLKSLPEEKRAIFRYLLKEASDRVWGSEHQIDTSVRIFKPNERVDYFAAENMYKVLQILSNEYVKSADRFFGLINKKPIRINLQDSLFAKRLGVIGVEFRKSVKNSYRADVEFDNGIVSPISIDIELSEKTLEEIREACDNHAEVNKFSSPKRSAEVLSLMNAIALDILRYSETASLINEINPDRKILEIYSGGFNFEDVVIRLTELGGFKDMPVLETISLGGGNSNGLSRIKKALLNIQLGVGAFKTLIHPLTGELMNIQYEGGNNFVIYRRYSGLPISRRVNKGDAYYLENDSNFFGQEDEAHYFPRLNKLIDSDTDSVDLLFPSELSKMRYFELMTKVSHLAALETVVSENFL